MADRMETLCKRILNVINEHGLRSVCDYGCGDGELLDYLKSENPELELYGIEYFAKLKMEDESDNYTRIDRDGDAFQELVGSRKFDLVVSTHALHHFQYPVKELRMIAGMIRPGGFFDMFDHCFDRDSQPGYARSLSSLIGEVTSALRGMYHRHHYTLEEASDLMLAISGEVVLQEAFRLDVPEGINEKSAQRNLDRIQRMMDKIKPKWPEFWLNIFIPLLELDYKTIETTGVDTAKMLNIVVRVDN